jgi:16S rRNA (uracil1498-N3)-methyltransferase
VNRVVHASARVRRAGLYTPYVSPRFYVPDARAIGEAVALPVDEAAHLLRVLRLKAGDAVRVFDGRGAEWQAVVDAVTKTAASVRLVAAVRPAREAGVDITLAAAVLKGEKMDQVVRDAVMLGVTGIRPFVSERSEVPLAAVGRGGRVARWQRIAIASAKQCGRAVVPLVSEAVTLRALFERAAPRRIMLVEPSAAAGVRRLADVPSGQAELVVGPEGGWTSDELAAGVAAGGILLTLGDQTLRADAVALVAISALRALWNDF